MVGGWSPIIVPVCSMGGLAPIVVPICRLVVLTNCCACVLGRWAPMVRLSVRRMGRHK